MGEYILSLDEGTTSARAILWNKKGEIISIAQYEFPQIYPKPGWVEHNPNDIWNAQYKAIKEAIDKAKISPEEIKAIGVTNQRETTILWDKKTGTPIHNAIVWQCRRTAEIVDWLKKEGYKDVIMEKTGLVPDSYFSGPKIKWLLDNIPNAKLRAKKGDILFGTVDTYLIWRLSGGKVHVTDYTNASRTMIYNINNLEWDEELLEILGIPKEILPDVRPSSEIYGYTDPKLLGKEIPIASAIGDQQAALVGQMGVDEGIVKCTYGTGNFILTNTGTKPVKSTSGLLTTIAYGIKNSVVYALEGSVFVTGAAIQWLVEGVNIINSPKETEELAKSVESNEGVYVVPAFTGLGAPYWDQYARGLIIGITRRTRKEHIVRAILESIAYQTRDVVEAMEKDYGKKIVELRIDGGVAKNNFVAQFQADILGKRVIRPRILETTSLGAAFLAGLATDYWANIDEIRGIWSVDRIYEPKIDEKERENLYKAWKEAVKRALGWAKNLNE
ncbi:MAG: glycerol kinase GlpK [Candidatus Njordarchaeia archaeon]